MPLPKNLPPSLKGPVALRDEEAAPRILGQRYRVDQRMGSGAFGTAFLVTDLMNNNERKVLKEIGVVDLLPDETVGAVKEANLLAKLDHPSIVKFHDSFLEKDYFCIVTELCEGGDLDQKVRQCKENGLRLGEDLIIDWFIQLTAAIMYIHDRRILHRDIKTRSMGVVLYELCTLQRAFSGNNLMAVMYSIVEGERPHLPADEYTPDLINLFDQMLDKDPRRRPSAVAILQLPFLHQRMESLHGKMVTQLIPVTSHPSSSSRTEAQAIANALTPIKKRSLQVTYDVTDDVTHLTPRQQLAFRKQQRADHEAEKRRKITARNFSEGRKRFTEHKKKQGKVVPPWVEEHPDVFSDPDFSITQPSSDQDCLVDDSLDLLEQQELQKDKQQQQQQQDWCGGRRTEDDSLDLLEQQELQKDKQQQQDWCGGRRTEDDSLDLLEQQELQKDKQQQHDWCGGRRTEDDQKSEIDIPDDPSLAETHYSQFDDFEEDSSSEDEYEALMGCIEDALDLPNQPIPESPPVSPHDHDELSPFSAQARDKKIQLLKLQCITIYGEELFQKIHSYIREARSCSVPHGDEASMVAGLKQLTSNTRDCFLIDQIVFLEKQK